MILNFYFELQYYNYFHTLVLVVKTLLCDLLLLSQKNKFMNYLYFYNKIEKKKMKKFYN